MVGAIEYLKKAKKICKSHEICHGCPLENICSYEYIEDEAECVKIVMEYELEGEDGH